VNEGGVAAAAFHWRRPSRARSVRDDRKCRRRRGGSASCTTTAARGARRATTIASRERGLAARCWCVRCGPRPHVSVSRIMLLRTRRRAARSACAAAAVRASGCEPELGEFSREPPMRLGPGGEPCTSRG
jgi:hypothetical protein